MAKKKTKLIRSSRYPAERQRIWEAIRKQQTFTNTSISKATKIDELRVQFYLPGLYKAGYIKPDKTPRGQKLSRDDFKKITWELINDVGIDAPRVTREGKPVKQGILRNQMWRTMKMLNRFTYIDLAIHASTDEHAVSRADAKNYCNYLHKAKYLSVVRAAVKGKKPKPALYQFINSKNTGPDAPIVQRIKVVFDPNLNEVVWSPPND